MSETNIQDSNDGIIEIDLSKEPTDIVTKIQEDENNEMASKDKEFEKKEEAVFSRSEIDIQNKNRKYRQDMIDALMKNGVPESSRDIRLLNELISAQEASVNSRANTRLKNKEIDQGGVDKQVIASILQNISIDGYEVSKTITDGREEKTGLTPELVPHMLSHGSDGLAEEILGKTQKK